MAGEVKENARIFLAGLITAGGTSSTCEGIPKVPKVPKVGSDGSWPSSTFLQECLSGQRHYIDSSYPFLIYVQLLNLEGESEGPSTAQKTT